MVQARDREIQRLSAIVKGPNTEQLNINHQKEQLLLKIDQLQA